MPAQTPQHNSHCFFTVLIFFQYCEIIHLLHSLFFPRNILRTYNCPYCQEGGLDDLDLRDHCNDNHLNDPRQVVSTIQKCCLKETSYWCAMPWPLRQRKENPDKSDWYTTLFVCSLMASRFAPCVCRCLMVTHFTPAGISLAISTSATATTLMT